MALPSVYTVAFLIAHGLNSEVVIPQTGGFTKVIRTISVHAQDTTGWTVNIADPVDDSTVFEFGSPGLPALNAIFNVSIQELDIVESITEGGNGWRVDASGGGPIDLYIGGWALSGVPAVACPVLRYP